ncbi:MAG TPA: site-2 protease family protein, partial [Verrucomicrobiae bacterium]|nr:site-2 protease family protein [Verrucomicrobiae bacterium]
IYLSISHSMLAGFIIGWGKPVPVDPSNLRHPRRDDTLIALAGPGMNFILAFLLMGLARAGLALSHSQGVLQTAGGLMINAGLLLVTVNLVLAFFNLIPIPPLDGSHVLKNAIGMSYETYWRLTQYGFIAIILVLQVPGVRNALNTVTRGTTAFLGRIYGIG